MDLIQMGEVRNQQLGCVNAVMKVNIGNFLRNC